MLKRVEMGAVTATAADDECLGPDATVRVGRLLPEGSLGWPWMRKPRVLGARAAAADAQSGSRPRCTFGGGLSTACCWMAYQAIRWEGFEPSTDSLRSCSTRLSYTTVEVIRDSNPAACAATFDDRFRCFRRRGMCGTHGRIRVPYTGGVHEPLTCERSPFTADSGAPEPFSSGAIPLAGARPATRARRRGCAGLQAESPRSGSARTAGTPAACPLAPACGRPCGRCTGRRQ